MFDQDFDERGTGKGRESNWLPAPKDKFVLMLRLYWPREKPPSLLDGTWKIPPLPKQDRSAWPAHRTTSR